MVAPPKHPKPETESRHNNERATQEQSDQKVASVPDYGAAVDDPGDDDADPEIDKSLYQHIDTKDRPQSQVAGAGPRTLGTPVIFLVVVCDILLLVVFDCLPSSWRTL